MRDIQRPRHKLSTQLVAGAAGAMLWSYSTCVAMASGLTREEPLPVHDQLSARGPQYAQAQQNSPALAPPSASPAPSKQDGSPKTADPATAKAGTPAIVVDGKQIESVLGKKVQSASGGDMGRIVDIIVDKSGQIRAAIIDFGGFLGVGSRQIAVAWSAIHFPMDKKSDAVEVGLTLDQLRVAPIYKPGEQIVVLGEPTQPPAAKPERDTAASGSDSQAPDSAKKELPAR